MKKSILSIIVLLAFGITAQAQTKDKTIKAKTNKVIVLVNTAKWCPACKANGQRVEENVVSQFMSNSKYQIVVNDMSDDKTKATSKAKCKKAGIAKIAESNTITGVIYFINANTKEIISQVSVVKTDEEIKTAFENAASHI